ncbi:hypothetical protein H6P81_011565 [Aristolochia fimbriata]|uniref:Hyccin n=1 Tax=Aristolochia fimbriata TaxID=158543 RepID=A0AAV7EU59_ARIFI|nr:hypothetical protein H6P81_011565 [Aristolochia fimbriata]
MVKESMVGMEIQQVGHQPSSPSPSTSTTSSSNPNHAPATPSWWESISKARAHIQSLSTLFPSDLSLSSLADSDRPAFSLLQSPATFAAVSGALCSPDSGAGDDPLCHWLYDTFQSSDPDLRLVVLSFIPLLAGLYLSRVVHLGPTPSLAGFEAVLLALYACEAKLRNGKPVLISVPDLSQPSLYHAPRVPPPSHKQPNVAVLSDPLEPQLAVKSTKRACIVAVALDSYYKKISHMPSWSKLDLCEFASAWAGQNCSCRGEFDREQEPFSCFENPSRGYADDAENLEDEMEKLEIGDKGLPNGDSVENGRFFRGSRIPLPWELLQPVLRILGHCLLAPMNEQDVREAAGEAVRSLYARAMHDVMPQAILATRSLIQLDKRARAIAKETIISVASNPSTPSKPRKPEILLASK